MNFGHSYWFRPVVAGDAQETSLQFSAATSSVTEGDSGTSVHTVTVTSSGNTSGTSTVAYATSDGTASAGTDYTATSGTLTFGAGVTSQTISITISGDTAVESDETFDITLSSPTQTVGTASITGTNPHVVTITNDDVANYHVVIEVHSSLSIETDGDYKYFYVDDSLDDAFTVTDAGSASGSDSIEVYCIGGGGGGGAAQGASQIGAGAGGGAGGYLRKTSFKNLYEGTTGLAQTYDVNVGGGGTGGLGSTSSTPLQSPTGGGDSQVRDTVSRSISFDGADDYISCGALEAWGFENNPFTVEAWIKIGSVNTSGYHGVISTHDGTNSPYGWILEFALGKFSIWNNNYRYTSTVDVADYEGKWIHLALVRSSTSTNGTKLYLNGEVIVTTTISQNFTANNYYHLQLGRLSPSGYYFDGLMSCVRVSDTARYSSAFAPPYEAFVDDTDTLLLVQPLSTDSGWVDRSAEDRTLTGYGPVHDYAVPTMCGFGGGYGALLPYGGSANTAPSDGGSGGGGGYSSPTTAGLGFSGQGSDGGEGGGGTPYTYAGGGGAGAEGGDWNDGAGGVGIQIEWMDDMNAMLGPDMDGFFAGGGGGGGVGGGGDGGSGGGGAGGSGAEDGSAGSVNSGGGGGGGGKASSSTNYDAGGGGSGKVLIRWKWQN